MRKNSDTNRLQWERGKDKLNKYELKRKKKHNVLSLMGSGEALLPLTHSTPRLLFCFKKNNKHTTHNAICLAYKQCVNGGFYYSLLAIFTEKTSAKWLGFLC